MTPHIPPYSPVNEVHLKYRLYFNVGNRKKCVTGQMLILSYLYPSVCLVIIIDRFYFLAMNILSPRKMLLEVNLLLVEKWKFPND